MFAIDPNAVLDTHCVLAADALTVGTFDIADASKIDIGNYEHVLIVASVGGGTTGGQVDITPKTGLTQTGPETAVPGAAFTFLAPNTASPVQKQSTFPVRGVGRWLQIEVNVTGTGNARVAVSVIGLGMRSTQGRNIVADRAEIGVA